MKSAILSDLGNVVVGFDRRRIVAALFRDLPSAFEGLSPEQVHLALHETREAYSALHAYECGRIDSRLFYELSMSLIASVVSRTVLITPSPDITFVPRDLVYEWVQKVPEQIFHQARLEMFRLNMPVVSLWRRIRAMPGVSLFALSNTDITCWSYLKGLPELRELFGGAIMSFEVGVMKPDVQIFQEAIKKTGMSAKHCFYVDDVPEYVEVARRLGIHAHQYKLGHADCDQGLTMAIEAFLHR